MVVNADKDDGRHADWNCRNKGEIIVIIHVEIVVEPTLKLTSCTFVIANYVVGICIVIIDEAGSIFAICIITL
jgi:hypothetical protein